MRNRWHSDALELTRWGIGDGWFEADPSEFPNLAAAARNSATELLGGLTRFVTFAETEARGEAVLDGVVAEVVDGRFRIGGTWGEVVLMLEHQRWTPFDIPPEERVVKESIFAPLAGDPFAPVQGTLDSASGAAILRREDERIWLASWEEDELIVHRVDGDLTWNHGETTPGAEWWRAHFVRS